MTQDGVRALGAQMGMACIHGSREAALANTLSRVSNAVFKSLHAPESIDEVTNSRADAADIGMRLS